MEENAKNQEKNAKESGNLLRKMRKKEDIAKDSQKNRKERFVNEYLFFLLCF